MGRLKCMDELLEQEAEAGQERLSGLLKTSREVARKRELR